MISVYDFINVLNKIDYKDEFYESHITRKYIDFEEKDAICDRIIQKTMYKDFGKERRFWINNNYANYFFRIEIINAYTDIKLGDKMELLFDYNRLNQIGFFEDIVKYIPEKEYNELRDMLTQAIKDTERNERDFVSYIEPKANIISLISDELLKSLKKEEVSIEE